MEATVGCWIPFLQVPGTPKTFQPAALEQGMSINRTSKPFYPLVLLTARPMPPSLRKWHQSTCFCIFANRRFRNSRDLLFSWHFRFFRIFGSSWMGRGGSQSWWYHRFSKCQTKRHNCWSICGDSFTQLRNTDHAKKISGSLHRWLVGYLLDSNNKIVL